MKIYMIMLLMIPALMFAFITLLGYKIIIIDLIIKKKDLTNLGFIVIFLSLFITIIFNLAYCIENNI